MNRLEQAVYPYGTEKYSYDAFNRMEKAERHDGQVQVNRYDAEGLRHEMEENGKLVQFLYSGREVVAETESDGNVIRYIRGLGLVCSDNEKAKTYYHYASDEMGSITHVVEKTKVQNCYEYDAFGNTTVCEEQVSNRFRFSGQQYDTVTGQYYLRARYYNPVIGRFLQEDNYYGDGLNLYAYCKNNPVSYVDPSGHGTQSAATKHSDPNNAQNAQDLLNLINEMNNTSGATADDIAVLKSLAEEFGLDPDSLGIKTVNEVNGPVVQELAADATPRDVDVIRDFAKTYDVDSNTVIIGESYGLNITLAQVDNIINTAKGSRMNPSSYLSTEYINAHLSQFEDGLSVIQTDWAYNRYSVTNGFVGVPDDNSLFVMPKNFCDEVIRRANGDISIIETELGFPKGYFSDG